MLGLVVIAFILAYLAISGLVIWLSARWARKRNRRPWVWGGLAALVMYNLVFWDLIPTLAMHKYYCATEAGFWVYKTPEQWVKENPGVVVRKVGITNWKHDQNGYIAPLNDRFQSVVRYRHPIAFLPTTITSEEIVDRVTGEKLARHVRVGSGYGSLGVGTNWRSMKLWFPLRPCLAQQESFGLFQKSVIDLGDKE